jgi:hypothetical protein
MIGCMKKRLLEQMLLEQTLIEARSLRHRREVFIYQLSNATIRFNLINISCILNFKK